MCITIDGRVYVFGGNQFGQLGTGASQGEVPPTSVITLNCVYAAVKKISMSSVLFVTIYLVCVLTNSTEGN